VRILARIQMCLVVCALLGIAGASDAQSMNWTAVDGGLITLLNYSDTPILLSGVDLQSTSGNLVPPPGPPYNATPFQFFLIPPTDKHTVYGILGSLVSLEARSSLELTTGVKVAPGDTIVSPPAEFVVPEPATGVMAALGPWVLLMFRRHWGAGQCRRPTGSHGGPF
jgi:hypothetical protein